MVYKSFSWSACRFYSLQVVLHDVQVLFSKSIDTVIWSTNPLNWLKVVTHVVKIMYHILQLQLHGLQSRKKWPLTLSVGFSNNLQVHYNVYVVITTIYMVPKFLCYDTCIPFNSRTRSCYMNSKPCNTTCRSCKWMIYDIKIWRVCYRKLAGPLNHVPGPKY